MSANPPTSPVLGKVFDKNQRIAPNATSNNGVTEKPNFSMAHPHKVPPELLQQLLGMLDLQNPDKQTNGVIKGNTKDGGTFMLTPGVLKFKKGKGKPGAPPAPLPPGNDQGPQMPPGKGKGNGKNKGPVYPTPALDQSPSMEYLA